MNTVYELTSDTECNNHTVYVGKCRIVLYYLTVCNYGALERVSHMFIAYLGTYFENTEISNVSSKIILYINKLTLYLT